MDWTIALLLILILVAAGGIAVIAGWLRLIRQDLVYAGLQRKDICRILGHLDWYACEVLGPLGGDRAEQWTKNAPGSTMPLLHTYGEYHVALWERLQEDARSFTEYRRDPNDIAMVTGRHEAERAQPGRG